MSGKGLPSMSWMLELGSPCVNVDWYCLLGLSAMYLATLNGHPLSFSGAITVDFFCRDSMYGPESFLF